MNHDDLTDIIRVGTAIDEARATTYAILADKARDLGADDVLAGLTWLAERNKWPMARIVRKPDGDRTISSHTWTDRAQRMFCWRGSGDDFCCDDELKWAILEGKHSSIGDNRTPNREGTYFPTVGEAIWAAGLTVGQAIKRNIITETSDAIVYHVDSERAEPRRRRRVRGQQRARVPGDQDQPPPA